jgi:hypothetical protein
MSGEKDVKADFLTRESYEGVCQGSNPPRHLFHVRSDSADIEVYEYDPRVPAARRVLERRKNESLAAAVRMAPRSDVHSLWNAFIQHLTAVFDVEYNLKNKKSPRAVDLCETLVDPRYLGPALKTADGVIYSAERADATTICAFALYTMDRTPEGHSFVYLSTLCGRRFGSMIVQLVKQIGREAGARLIYLESVAPAMNFYADKGGPVTANRDGRWVVVADRPPYAGQGFLQSDDACDANLEEQSRCGKLYKHSDVAGTSCRMTYCLTPEGNRSQVRGKSPFGFVLAPEGFPSELAPIIEFAPPADNKTTDVQVINALQNMYRWPSRTLSKRRYLLPDRESWLDASNRLRQPTVSWQAWSSAFPDDDDPRSRRDRQIVAINLFMFDVRQFFDLSIYAPRRVRVETKQQRLLTRTPFESILWSDIVHVCVVKNLPEQVDEGTEDIPKDLAAAAVESKQVWSTVWRNMFASVDFQVDQLDDRYRRALFWLIRGSGPSAYVQVGWKSLIDTLYLKCSNFVRAGNNTRLHWIQSILELSKTLSVSDLVYAIKFDLTVFHSQLFLADKVRTAKSPEENDLEAVRGARLSWYLLLYLHKYLRFPEPNRQELIDSKKYVLPKLSTTTWELLSGLSRARGIPALRRRLEADAMLGHITTELLREMPSNLLLTILLSNDHLDLIEHLSTLSGTDKRLQKFALRQLVEIPVPLTQFAQATKEGVLKLKETLQTGFDL